MTTMTYYYQYQGTISMTSDGGRSCVVDDIDNYDKPPVALTVPCQALAEYIEGRSWTDAEERYISQTWLYDRNLFLQAIIIPSKHEYIPAKVIACAKPDLMAEEIVIFGPADLIESAKPEPMDNENFSEWMNFRSENGLRPRN